jgi:hypothetical protein
VRFSKGGYQTIVSSVSTLPCGVRDAEVPGLVVPVVVDPVEGLSRLAREADAADIVAVGYEIVTPGVTETDAAATPAVKVSVFWIVASGYRTLPPNDLSCTTPLGVLTVKGAPVASDFLAPTAAGAGISRTQ